VNNSTTFSCIINSTDFTANIGIEICLDQLQIFNSDHIDSIINFNYPVNDDDAEHEINFIMKNKTIDHNRVDENGNILQDVCLTIDHLAFDGIEIGHNVVEQIIYKHNFNGTQPEVTDKFYGKMGCNGTVSLKFTTPIYLWLLEHM
jgi:hypothetical protein